MLAMTVFIGHLGGTIGENDFTRSWAPYGGLAPVTAFFTISGFSIAHSIQQRPKRYIARRLWRIWPTYLFSFFACTLPAALILPHYTTAYPANQQPTAWLIIANLLMLQGTFLPVLEANAATWTLAIEEWFYLGAPLFKRCANWVLWLLILGSAFCYVHARGFGWIRFAGQTWAVSHLSFFWAWMLGFVFYRQRNSVGAHLALFLLPVWLVSGATDLGGIRAGFTVLATALVIAFGGTLMSLLDRVPETLVEVEWKRGRFASIRWHPIREFLLFLGNVSYPLYIIHYPIFFLLFHLTSIRNHLFYGVSTFLLCVVVYFAVDKPNRKRWQPKHPQPARA